ncbi:MAG: glycosyltransferase, partial [Nitrososphaeria archaeon]
MKVLFFSRRFWPDIGGVEKHVLKLSEELKKRGHDIIIVAEKEINQNNNKLSKSDLEFNISGIKVFKIPITTSEKNKKFQIWFWLLKNIRLIKSADIIHCHDVFYWYLPFLFLFPRKKIFTTFHGYEGSEP